MENEFDITSEEKSPDNTHFVGEEEKTLTRWYLIGILLPTSLILLLLIFNTMAKLVQHEYGDEWEGGNDWEFHSYMDNQKVWTKDIEIDPNEDGSYTYIHSNAPGDGFGSCSNDFINSNYTISCDGTYSTGFSKEVLGMYGSEVILIGQYSEANKTLWFKPPNGTGVAYGLTLEVYDIDENINRLEVANTFGSLLLLGMVGFASMTHRKTENSERKSISEGVLAVANVGLWAALLALIGTILLSVFIGFVSLNSY